MKKFFAYTLSIFLVAVCCFSLVGFSTAETTSDSKSTDLLETQVKILLELRDSQEYGKEYDFADPAFVKGYVKYYCSYTMKDKVTNYPAMGGNFIALTKDELQKVIDTLKIADKSKVVLDDVAKLADGKYYVSADDVNDYYDVEYISVSDEEKPEDRSYTFDYKTKDDSVSGQAIAKLETIDEDKQIISSITFEDKKYETPLMQHRSAARQSSSATTGNSTSESKTTTAPTTTVAPSNKALAAPKAAAVPWSFNGVNVTSKDVYSVGDTITITPNTTGTATNVKYKYVWSHNDWSTWGVISQFSTANSVTYKLTKPGTYDFYIDANEGSKTVTKFKRITVLSTKWNLSKVNVTSSAAYYPGQTVTITPTIAGTGSNMKYKFVWSYNNWSTWGVVRDFSTTASASFKFSKAGKYDLYIDATDGTNTITKYATINVTPASWNLSKANVTSKAVYSIGEPISITPTISGGTSYVTYKYVWSHNNWNTWGVISNFSANKSATFTPTKTGVYDFYIDATDGNKTTTKSVRIEVVNTKWNLNKVNVTTQSVYYTGQTITISPGIAGTASNMKYKYVWAHNGWSTWGVIKDFSTATSTTFTLTKPGTYQLYIDANDGSNTITKYATINVSTSWYNNGATFSAAPYRINTPMTITAKPSGSAYGAQYKYVYYYENWKYWGVIKDFSSSQSISFTPPRTGKCTIVIDMMVNGVVKSTSTTIDVQKQWNHAGVSIVEKPIYKVNSPVTIKASASGNTSGLRYKYVWSKNDWKEWGVIAENSTASSIKYTPKTEGVYDLYVDIKDATGALETKSIKIYVSNQGWVISGHSLSKASPATQGESIKITTNVAGYQNINGMKYKFVWSKENWSKWGVIQTYSTTNYATWTPTEPGVYTLYVDCVDTTGFLKTLEIPYVVNSKTTSSVKVDLSHTSASIPQGKTMYINAKSVSPASAAIKYISNNSNIATVYSSGTKAYITGVNNGKTQILAVDSSGKTAAICDVTITNSEPIKFAYTSPNSAPKNSTVEMYAITDKTRDSVRFYVNGQTITASSKVVDGNTYVWKASIKMSNAGEYSVTAYSSKGGSWTTCSNGNTSIYVTSSTDTTTTTTGKRRMSDKGVQFLAESEGFSSSVYNDLGGTPTIGYGKVVYAGDKFYNNLTKKEGLAMMLNLVNTASYSTNVNKLFVDNGIKFNQQQFDALVSFSYNVGASWTLQMYNKQLRAIVLASANKDLNLVNKQAFANEFNTWHHMSNGTCVQGLVSRRINELEMFFYGDYVRTMPPKLTSQNSWFYYDMKTCPKQK